MDKSISKSDIEKVIRFTKTGVAVHTTDIAKIFGKRHDNILRLVKSMETNLLNIEENSQDYFKDTSYADSKNRKYLRYEFTRKGFDLIVLSLTGEKAMQYKIWFIDEFHNKESTIKSNKQLALNHKAIPFMVELREEGKKCRKELIDSIQKFDVPLGVEVGKDEAEFLRLRIINYTKMINKILNIKTSAGVVARDILEGRELLRLEDVELKASRLIEKHHADKGMDYKKLYQRVKVKLEEYCE